MTRAERLLTALVVAWVLFAPLFLGGVGRFDRDWNGQAPGLLERFLWAEGPWAVQLVLAAAVAATAAVVARESAAAGERSVLARHGALLWPLLGLGALAILQAIPLPRGVLGLISPRGASELELLLPGDASARPITVSPQGTGDFLAGLAMGIALLTGTLLAARRRAAAAAVAGALVIAFTGSALYGLCTTYLGDDRVLIFPKKEHLGVTGTFLNRSSLAGGVGLALPVALALLAISWKVRRGAFVAAGVAAAVLLVTVPLTRSRGGLGAAAVGLAALGALASLRRFRSPWVRGGLALALVGVVAFGATEVARQVPGLRERFQFGTAEGGFFDLRFPVWEASLELAARNPAVGTGLGSFEIAIHETQRPETPDEAVHAHCEPLEFLVEGGLPGLVLAFLAAGGVLAICVRAASSEDGWTRALGCGCGAGLASLLAGSLFEFHFHIPALGFAAAVAAALPAAALSGTPRDAPSAIPGTGVLKIAGAALVLIVGATAWSDSVAAAHRGEAVRAARGGDYDAGIAAARRAVEADPDDPFSRRLLARALLRGWDQPTIAADAALSLVEADHAVALEPFQAWNQWSRVEALAAAQRLPELADAVARARRRAGGIAHLHYSAGLLLYRIAANDPSYLAAALDAFRESGLIEDRRFTDAWSLVEADHPRPEVLERLVPNRVLAWTQFARWCERRGLSEREVLARARAARLQPQSADLREACLEAARKAGLEELAERALRGDPR